MAKASYRIKALIAGTALVAVAGCTGLDTDFRDVTGGFSTSTPQEGAPTLARPEPDARGVISVTERQAYIGRVRALAKKCADAFVLTEAGGGAAA